MNSISKNSIRQTLKQYLYEYRHIFKKRSFDIFYWLVLSILALEEVRSIKFVYDNFIKKYTSKALNSLYYFLSYVNFNIDSLMKITTKIALSLIPENLKDTEIFITIDDTLQAKFGEKFDCHFKLFDHTNKTGNSYLKGHCFISLVINIPLWNKNHIKYLSLPIGYKLYDKTQSKLEIAAQIIDSVMEYLEEYKVILLCDSWYSKGAVLNTVKKHNNLELIGAVRSDTAIYDLPPAPTGKRERPRQKGNKLDIKSFSYTKIDRYYIATKKVITRLFQNPVYITVTTTDLKNFKSVRMYISTINPENINVFKGHEVDDIKYDSSLAKIISLCAYSIRWNIEVIFYQHKFFWSFGNYMVRNKEAIERFINLIAISFTFVSVLPFISKNFSDYKFESPQVIKRIISERVIKELIFDSFVSSLENIKIYSVVFKCVKNFIYKDFAA